MSLYTPQAHPMSVFSHMQDLKADSPLTSEALMFKAIARAVTPVPRHQVQSAEGAQLQFSELSAHVNFPVNNSVSPNFQRTMLCILTQMLHTSSDCD